MYKVEEEEAMNRLSAIGFEKAGHWYIAEDKLNLSLIRHGSQYNVLYAFICDGEVMYIGKTIQKLSARMQGYKTPGVNQPTNIRNNELIFQHLRKDEAVDIYVLPDNGLMHYGGFHINMAAALEDDLIRQIKPSWNGGKVEAVISPDVNVAADQIDEVIVLPMASFTITLGPTYHGKGFFNVPVANQNYFGWDGQNIELFVGDSSQPITGSINRRANSNGSPRIFGGAALRDLIQRKWNVMDEIQIDVLSPTSFRLR